MSVLDDAAIDAGLAGLTSWEREGAELVRRYDAESFLAGMDRVRAIAVLAEAADHHPDIDIRWRRLTFRLSTHSEGGITARDLALAAQIEEALQ